MKHTLRSYIPSSLILALLLVHGCTKDTGLPAVAPNAQSTQTSHVSVPGAGLARYSGPNYSQSISLATANGLIGSYLNSVGYPAADTALRAFSFDADTLRAYLQNSNIVTLKFMLAHQPAYKAAHNGLYAGMNPAALTLVVVGQDEDDDYILNTRGEVYDNMIPCPTFCGNNAGPFIQ